MVTVGLVGASLPGGRRPLPHYLAARWKQLNARSNRTLGNLIGFGADSQQTSELALLQKGRCAIPNLLRNV